MDCQMPEIDGYTAARAIRLLERGRKVPIIALTASAMVEDRLRCLNAGMDECLPKPIYAERLYELIETFSVGALARSANA